jgi:hypothetical protein
MKTIDSDSHKHKIKRNLKNIQIIHNHIRKTPTETRNRKDTIK